MDRDNMGLFSRKTEDRVGKLGQGYSSALISEICGQ